jgi:hypothetical protein
MTPPAGAGGGTRRGARGAGRLRRGLLLPAPGSTARLGRRQLQPNLRAAPTALGESGRRAEGGESGAGSSVPRPPAGPGLGRGGGSAGPPPPPPPSPLLVLLLLLLLRRFLLTSRDPASARLPARPPGLGAGCPVRGAARGQTMHRAAAVAVGTAPLLAASLPNLKSPASGEGAREREREPGSHLLAAREESPVG